MKKPAAYLTPALRIAPAFSGLLKIGLLLGLFMVLAACRVVRTTPSLPAAIETDPTDQIPVSGQQTASPNPTATSSSTPMPTSAIHVDTRALRGLILHFWHPYAGEAQVVLDRITREFNQTNEWGIRVENTSIPGFTLLEQNLKQAAQDQILPDVWSMFTYQALQIDANGTVVADLRPYIEDAKFGLSSTAQEDFIPAVWKQDLVPPPALKGRASPEGKRIGLAWTRGAQLLVYNQTWAQELGFDSPPESAQAFRLQVCAAAQANNKDSERSNDGSGGLLVTGDPGELIGWLQAFEARFSREDGRGYQFDTPEARQAVSFLYDLKQDGCAWLSESVAPETALAERKALLVVMNLADLEALQLPGASLPAATPSLVPGEGTPMPTQNAQIVPSPAPTATLEPTDTWLPLPFPSSASPALVAFGPSLVVAQSEPERQLAAWLFVRWLTLPENQALWVQATHTLPVRRSAVKAIPVSQLQDPPAWGKTVSYLPYLQAEPYYVSWGVVRLTLGDAVLHLFQSQDSEEQVTQILSMLDALAAEIQLQIR